MKLAEALQRRTDLVRKLDDLKERIRNNALVQDGEQPVENPKALLKEYDDSVAELGDLISKINITNCRTVRNGRTLTEIIARKDVLEVKRQAYRVIADTANSNTARARNAEVKVLPTLDVTALRKTADAIAKEIRELDNTLQETNWTTELIEE